MLQLLIVRYINIKRLCSGSFQHKLVLIGCLFVHVIIIYRTSGLYSKYTTVSYLSVKHLFKQFRFPVESIASCSGRIFHPAGHGFRCVSCWAGYIPFDICDGLFPTLELFYLLVLFAQSE